MATYEFQHVLDVEITAAIQNKGAFSSQHAFLPLRGRLENSHLSRGLIYALVLLLCEGNTASSRPK